MGRRRPRRGARPQSPPVAGSDVDPVKLPAGAAAEDVFTYVLDRSDMIRQRAQYAAAVAGVVAGAITVAVLSTLGKLDDLATFGLLLAVVAWIISLGLWVTAIGGEVEPVETHLVDDPPGVNLKEAVQQAKCNAGKVRSRVNWARRLTVLAVAVTLVAVVWAGYDAEQEDERVAANLWLTAQGAEATARSCGWTKKFRLIHGNVALTELTTPVVTLQIDRRNLRLRSNTVLTVAKVRGG